MKTTFNSIWKPYEPIIHAIVELFHPFVEVAIHDLEKGKIVALFNTVSRRKVGDASPLKELTIESDQFPAFFSPYFKENWDGRKLKCTSITLKNNKGKPVVLICINADVSFMFEAQRVIDTFLRIKDASENPIEIFGGRMETQVNAIIDDYLEEKSLSLAHLDREEKKLLVQHLYHKGVFNYKNAAPYLAKKLESSRATIYNYIKQF